MNICDVKIDFCDNAFSLRGQIYPMMTATSPFQTADADKGRRIGLALAGGGFRASFFHIGVLARLAELDLLRQVDILSCVSGGSVIGALYYLYLKRELDAHGDLDTPRLIGIVAEMERHFLNVVQKNLKWRVYANLRSNFRLARNDYSSTDRFADLLDRHLYRPIFGGDAGRPVEMRTLDIQPRGQRDFNPITDNAGRHCKVPALMINAAVLNTGHNWRFGADRMGEPARPTAAREVDRNWLLCQSRYNGLHHDYADLGLGQAVAASAAAPGLLRPLTLNRLYPHPHHPAEYLRAELVDGGLHDGLGTEVLRERGCTHFLISDGSRKLADHAEPDYRQSQAAGRTRDILSNRVRTLQLSRLKERKPNNVALIHMMREMEALELKPVGPADKGHVIRDRSQTETTSYGVDRHVQSALARIRTDVDAFSDTEALALMADGYLLTRQCFEEPGERRDAWMAVRPFEGNEWTFSAIFEILQKPTPSFLRRLHIARFRHVKGLRLVPKLRFEAGLVAFALLFCLSAAMTILVTEAPEIGSETIAIAEFAIILLLLAYPAYRALTSAVHRIGALHWLKPPLRLIDGVVAIAMAFPLYLIAASQLYAGRHFVKAGTLSRVGIDQVKPAKAGEPHQGEEMKRRRITRKAA